MQRSQSSFTNDVILEFSYNILSRTRIPALKQGVDTWCKKNWTFRWHSPVIDIHGYRGMSGIGWPAGAAPGCEHDDNGSAAAEAAAAWW